MEFRESLVGQGQVVLIAGGGKIFTDIAARFVGSERELEEIIASPYSAKIVKNILANGHLAATEFDYFIFGISGFSRVTEVQLVRKRLASYLVKSGRVELKGKRAFSVVYPEKLQDFHFKTTLPTGHTVDLSVHDLIKICSDYYEQGLEQGLAEEDLRYFKPQATEFKAIIGMNVHALRDWFGWRCCQKAQAEIRDLAWKMLKLCQEAAPDLFIDAGPRCQQYGYCPELSQHALCALQHKCLSRSQALERLKN